MRYRQGYVLRKNDALIFNFFYQKYGDLGNGQISVHNYQTTDSPNSNIQTIDGYAYVPDAAEPGQLKVHFSMSISLYN